jgi:type 1 glutamine amidotransferase
MRFIGCLVIVLTTFLVPLARAEGPTTRPLTEVPDAAAVESQSEITLPDGGVVKLGIGPLDPELGPWRMVYCRVEKHGEKAGKSMTGQGNPTILGPLVMRYEWVDNARYLMDRGRWITVIPDPPGVPALYQAAVPLRREGRLRVTIETPDGVTVAVGEYDVKDRHLSSWRAFARAVYDRQGGPDRLITSRWAAPVIPRVEGLSSAAVDGRTALPTLKLSLEGDVFQIDGDGKLLAESDDCLLARWWVNGEPRIPNGRESQAIIQQGRKVLPPKPMLTVGFGLPVDLSDCTPGDRIGIQVMYSPGGWEYFDDVKRLELKRMTRRDLLPYAISNRLELAVTPELLAVARKHAAADPRSRRVLFFTKSSGFEHDGVKRKDGAEGWAEAVFRRIANQSGFDVTVSKDGGVFDSPEFDRFDVFAFYTSGDLTQKGTDGQPPMTATGKQRLLDAVAGGKGFVGIHCASDTFRGDGKPDAPPDPYIEMLGGRFTSHGEQQRGTIRVVATDFGPGEAPQPFVEEWYAFNYLDKDLRVIHELQTKELKGDMYTRDPYPVTWTRKHGKGRVFYTALGHRQDVWESAFFRETLAAGLSWAGGR